MYTIEKGKTFSKSTMRTGMTEIMKKMEIGDSFICSLNQRASARPIAAKIGIKVLTAKEGNNARILRVN